MKTDTKILISQSMLRDFYGSPTTSPICRQLFYKKYIEGMPFEPSDSMKLGLAYESKLLGACRGGSLYELPKLKNGVLSKAEQDLDAIVTKAKDLLAHLKMEFTDVQPEWIINDLTAHPDCVAKSILAERAIIDIKYSGYGSNDRFSPWANPENIDKTQAIHYVYVNYLLTGEYLPFFFIIFFKDGGAKILDCKLTVTAMNAHISLLDHFRKESAILKPDMPVDADYNQCVKCPLFGKCKIQATVPQILELVA
jgi:hypothetical protein